MPASAHSLAMFERVQLGATGLGVVEIAPREHAHPVQPRLGGDVAELRHLDRVVGSIGMVGSIAGRSSDGAGWS